MSFQIDTALRDRIPLTTCEFETIHGPIDDSAHYRPIAEDSEEDEAPSRRVNVCGSGGGRGLFDDEVVDEGKTIYLIIYSTSRIYRHEMHLFYHQFYQMQLQI